MCFIYISTALVQCYYCQAFATLPRLPLPIIADYCRILYKILCVSVPALESHVFYVQKDLVTLVRVALLGGPIQQWKRNSAIGSTVTIWPNRWTFLSTFPFPTTTAFISYNNTVPLACIQGLAVSSVPNLSVGFDQCQCTGSFVQQQ